MINPYKHTVFVVEHRHMVQTQSDAAERGVWSGSPLSAYIMFYQNLNKNEKYHLTTLKTEMEWSDWLEWEFPFGFYGLIGNNGYI